MVQTEAQYVFLHDAILEEANSGNTEVSVNKLNQRMRELEKVDQDEESGYKKEFQVSPSIPQSSVICPYFGGSFIGGSALVSATMDL